jgi:protease I
MKAIMITGKYVQDHEYIYPYYRLQEAGYDVSVATETDDEKTFNGIPILSTRHIPHLSDPNEKYYTYDLLVLPGGAKSMEYLRQNGRVIEYISYFHKKGGVIASICHGAQLLISAGIVKGNKISGYYSIKDDINNAGAEYVNAPFVISDRIITSPHYKYLGQWMKATLEEVERCS